MCRKLSEKIVVPAFDKSMNYSEYGKRNMSTDLHDNLNMNKVCGKRVSKVLSEEQGNIGYYIWILFSTNEIAKLQSRTPESKRSSLLCTVFLFQTLCIRYRINKYFWLVSAQLWSFLYPYVGCLLYVWRESWFLVDIDVLGICRIACKLLTRQKRKTLFLLHSTINYFFVTLISEIPCFVWSYNLQGAQTSNKISYVVI